MNLDEHVRKIIAEELDKLQQKIELVPVAQFCREKNVTRVTLWRAEKAGKIKLVRIGKKVFINPNQFKL